MRVYILESIILKECEITMGRRILAIAVLLMLLAESSCYSTAGSVRSPVIYANDKILAAQTAENIKEELSMGESARSAPVIADHSSTKPDQIPGEWIENAKSGLHIAYGHTSHGSQITTGLSGLSSFKGEPYIYKKGERKDSLDIRDNPFGGEKDLGNPDNKTWAEETRKYLDRNKDINVVVWSWCGQLSTGDSKFVKNYLELMQSLETQYPGVTFVYMTGHLDGTGEEGTLFKSNNTIREFCKSNNKVLYDFADIESYDPDGNYFADKYANDHCWYDKNGDKKHDRNWAQDWQNSHTKGVDWYTCEAAHTEPLNANMKAYAFWWLMAKLAGWGSDTGTTAITEEKNFDYYANKLQSLGLFKGTDKGFDLESVPTRLQGAVMLTRLLGGEKEAMSELYIHPFKDAAKSWGNSYVGYLYHHKLTKGVSANSFGCDEKLYAVSYITMVLRLLSYSDSGEGGDFTWNGAVEAARDFGIIDTAYYNTLKKSTFTRGHMVKLTCLALEHKLKGSDITLFQKLVQDNAINQDNVNVLK